MVDSDKYLDIPDRSLHDPSFEHIARDIRPPGTSPICIRGEHGCHDRRISGTVSGLSDPEGYLDQLRPSCRGLLGDAHGRDRVISQLLASSCLGVISPPSRRSFSGWLSGIPCLFSLTMFLHNSHLDYPTDIIHRSELPSCFSVYDGNNDHDCLRGHAPLAVQATRRRILPTQRGFYSGDSAQLVR